MASPGREPITNPQGRPRKATNLDLHRGISPHSLWPDWIGQSALAAICRHDGPNKRCACGFGLPAGVFVGRWSVL